MSNNQGGSYGLNGYLYQVLVSVWVAVDLLLVAEAAERLELEPLSQEDIEANLRDPDFTIEGSSKSKSGYTLRFQVKSSTGEPWSIDKFRVLMAEGGKNRTSPRDRLISEPTSRYLLITNNSAVNTLRAFNVANIGVWPTGEKLPSLWKRNSPEGSARVSDRVAVISAHDEERIREKIKSGLITKCHVPMSRWSDCLTALYLEALEHMKPNVDHQWRKTDLIETIDRFGGYLGPSRSDADYVKPQNWPDIVSHLNKHHAIIVKGESGTGKTSAARALISYLKDQVPGIELVEATTPSSIRYYTPRPVVFYLDDPWGKSRFEPHAEPWRNELASLIRIAGPDTKFVVTTRSDVFDSADLEKVHKRWIVSLESSDYAPRDRYAMYRNRIPSLPTEMHSLVAEMRGYVLRELRSPFEIDQFFSNLGGQDLAPEDERRDQISSAVERAHISSIQDNIRSQVDAMQASSWGVVLWGLLCISESLSRDFLRNVHTRMGRLNETYAEDGLDELASFFVKGKSFKESNSILSYAHPQVSSALRSIVQRSPMASQRTLNLLCQALTNLDSSEGKIWSSEALAKLAGKLPPNIHFSEVFDTPIATQMNCWLVNRCLTGGGTFEDKLRQLARSGQPDFVPAEVARFLTEKCVIPMFGDDEFVPFEPDLDWIRRGADHQSTRALCSSFVTFVLPHVHEDHQADFIEIMERIAGDLTDAFVEAVVELRNLGFRPPQIDTIMVHASRDLQRMKQLAVEALPEYQKVDLSLSDEEWIAKENKHYGEDDPIPWDIAEWESVAVLDDCIQYYVTTARTTLGWREFSADPTSRGMEQWWLSVLLKGSPISAATDVEEILELWSRTKGTRNEQRFWEVASNHWHAELADALVNRLVEYTSDKASHAAALLCARSVDAGRFIVQAVEQFEQNKKWSSLLDFLSDIDRPWRREQFKATQGWSVATPLQCLSSPYREMFTFILGYGAKEQLQLHHFLEFIEALEPSDDDARLAVIRAKVQLGLDPVADIRWLLMHCYAGTAASEALDVAHRHVDEEDLRAATEHKYGKVKATAVRLLRERGAFLDPNWLHSLARDPSWYVKDVAFSIASKQPDKFKATLHQFLEDTWTDHSHSDHDDPHYPFAQKAAQVLAEAGFTTEDDERCYLDVGFASQDWRVRSALLKHLVSTGSKAAREEIMAASLVFEPRLGRVEAATALASQHMKVEPEIADAVKLEHLKELDANVAVLLSKLVGSRLGESRARDYAEALRTDPERRVLLLPFGIGAAARPPLQAAIKGMFPSKHPALGVFGPALGSLDPECLSDLGGHEEVDAVRHALKRWFCPKD